VHIVPAPGAGAPPPSPAGPAIAETKSPAPAAVRRIAVRSAVKPAEPEPVEFLPFARWRKMVEQQKKGTARTAASYPPTEYGQ
jgi:hypothetical protein